jgi:hypothetical protein
MGAENLAPTGIRSPNHPACRETLCTFCKHKNHFSMSVTIPTMIHHLPTLMGKENKLWSSSLSTITYPPITFFYSGPNTFSSNTFTNILNLQIQRNNPHIMHFKALSKRLMQCTTHPVGWIPNVLTAHKSHLLHTHHVYSHYAQPAEQCQIQQDCLLLQHCRYQCYCWVMYFGAHRQDLFPRTVYINRLMSVDWAQICTILKRR